MKCKSFVAQAKYESVCMDVCVCVYISNTKLCTKYTHAQQTHTAHTHTTSAQTASTATGVKKFNLKT